MAILSIDKSVSRYLPGENATVSVTWRNDTGISLTGNVRARLLSHGRQVGADVNTALTAIASGATTTVSFSVSLPPIDFRGYLLRIDILNSVPAVVDSGIGALEVASDWARFPRMAFLTNFSSGLDTAEVIQSLNRYGITSLQYYDIAFKHQAPLSTASSWPNLANTQIHRATLESYISNAAARRMGSFAYNLWNGAQDSYRADGKDFLPRTGIFTDSSLTQQVRHGPFPASWAAEYLMDFDPADPRFSARFFANMKAWLDQYNFDGWFIDTLGNAGTQYLGDKSTVYLGSALAPYTRAAKAATGKSVVLNNISRWEGRDIATRGAGDFLYSETWGDARNFPDLNAAANSYRACSRQGIVLAGYIHTGYPGEPPGYGDVNYGSSTVKVVEASVRHLQSVMWSVGVYHLCFGDVDRIASNIFWPGPMIGMNTATRDALLALHAFGLAHENLLRDGVVDALELATATKSGIVCDGTGAAGKVWVLPKAKAGFQILHLHNFVSLPSNEWKDVAGVYPAPTEITNIAVKMYYGGAAIVGANKLFIASPDSGGVPVDTAYTTGSDGGGNFITFTVPRLLYWTMCWLETNTLSPATTDYEIVATQPISAACFQRSSRGVGSTAGNIISPGAGDWVIFDRVNCGAGVTTVSVFATSPVATTIEVRDGGPNGALLATIAVPVTVGYQTISAPISASGVRDICLVWPGPAIGAISFLQFG